MRANLFLVAALALPLSLAACGDPPTYLDGKDFSSLQFHYFSDHMGVYPDVSVMLDPNNPFAYDLPSDTMKWEIQKGAGPIASFYAWASLLANGPYGEAQFYVAKNLQQMVDIGKIDDTTKPKVTDLAIRAYLSVLYNFPTDVTYDSSGKIPIDLATPSYKAVVLLSGGMAPPGWKLVMNSDGTGVEAVRK